MPTPGLTEREIIAIFRKQFDTNPKLPLRFNEDVAALPSGKHGLFVLKSDMLVGKTDVPASMTVRQAARKAVVATVSDFAAKGVQPRALLISLGLTAPVRSSTVSQIATGLSEGAREYRCKIIGGDTSQTSDLIIDCIGFGVSETGRIMRRDGARPGNILATTGDFGKTSAGLRILSNRNKRLQNAYPRLVRSVTRPVARLSTGLKLARSGALTSSIDSSDGLAWSLSEIARLSRVNIFVEDVPVDIDAAEYAVRERFDPTDLALFGGEEYELVVTVTKQRFESVRRMNPSLKRIGVVEKGSGVVRARIRDKVRRVEPRGYQHFS